MKKVISVFAVLLALSLVIVPFPAAEAAGTQPGDVVTVSFEYNDVAGISGDFTVEDASAMIVGDVTYSWDTLMGGDVTNDYAWFESNNCEPTDIVINVTFKVSNNAQVDDQCTITFDYDISDELGNIVESKTESKIVKIGAPTESTTQPTEPSTQPTQPSTQPTQPSTQPTQPSTQPTQPSTQPTQPSTQPTQPSTQPTQPSTQPTQPSTQPTTPTEPSKPSELDFTELKKLINEAKELNEMDYTADSWANLQTALTQGKSALKATSQSKIDAAAAALAEAINNLVKLNYQPLTDAIESTESFLNNGALEGKLAALLEKLDAAKALVNNARTQEEIDTAAQALADALADLEAYLKDLIGKTEIVEVDNGCENTMHYVWPILFFVCLALNVIFVAVIVYLLRRMKKEIDDTPVVDYDIGDDA